MRERVRRVLKASIAGIRQANKALCNLFTSKICLANELDISCTTVQKFLVGKPVERGNFYKICQKLELDWWEIADYADDEVQSLTLAIPNAFDVDALVQEVRHKGRASIQHKCGMMRVLDMPHPMELNDIYVNVNILETISKRLEVDVHKVRVTDSERLGVSGAQERINGLEAVKKYSQVIVVGKPGAGKTTFLKYIAMQCMSGRLHANLVPIFITLKDVAETEQCLSLFEYIHQEFSTYGIYEKTAVEEILREGKALVLLDGLDEVRTMAARTIQEIRNFTARFPRNHFVITSRIVTPNSFKNFTEIEVADFDREQIATFASKWFAAKDPEMGIIFIQKLNQNLPIQDLATNPLLLTLLCLRFEDLADFPSSRFELYKEGLNVLLKKWDANRNIEREQIYKQLSVKHKEDLLSQIALKTFEQGDYFFTQKEIEGHIADYIYNLIGATTDIDTLQLDSTAVLKSIEAQHGLLVERAKGIYSFSHITFHEYFTAREITSSADPQVLEITLKQLASRVTEKRWREVIFLAASMLRNADYLLLLMQQQINALAGDNHLQAFLTWVSQKSRTVTAPYKLATVRVFYIALQCCLTIVDKRLPLNHALVLSGSILEIAFVLDPCLTVKCNMELDTPLKWAIDLALDRALTLALARALVLHRVIELDLSLSSEIDLSLSLELDLTRALDLALDPSLDRDLQWSLKQLEAQLPDPEVGREKFKQWWKAKGEAWTKKLRDVMISYRNIGYNWQFNEQQQEALRQYYDASRLLVDCLNSDCYVSRWVRQEIEETLFLPIISCPFNCP